MPEPVSDAYAAGRARASAENQRALEAAAVRLVELESMTEAEVFRAGAHAEANRLRWMLARPAGRQGRAQVEGSTSPSLTP